MKFTLTIDCDNAAFEAAGEEVSRILDAVSVLLDREGMSPGMSGPVFDINGNRVGSWEVTVGDVTAPDDLLAAAKAIAHVIEYRAMCINRDANDPFARACTRLRAAIAKAG